MIIIFYYKSTNDYKFSMLLYFQLFLFYEEPQLEFKKLYSQNKGNDKIVILKQFLNDISNLKPEQRTQIFYDYSQIETEEDIREKIKAVKKEYSKLLIDFIVGLCVEILKYSKNRFVLTPDMMNIFEAILSENFGEEIDISKYFYLKDSNEKEIILQSSYREFRSLLMIVNNSIDRFHYIIDNYTFMLYYYRHSFPADFNKYMVLIRKFLKTMEFEILNNNVKLNKILSQCQNAEDRHLIDKLLHELFINLKILIQEEQYCLYYSIQSIEQLDIKMKIYEVIEIYNMIEIKRYLEGGLVKIIKENICRDKLEI